MITAVAQKVSRVWNMIKCFVLDIYVTFYNIDGGLGRYRVGPKVKAFSRKTGPWLEGSSKDEVSYRRIFLTSKDLRKIEFRIESYRKLGPMLRDPSKVGSFEGWIFRFQGPSVEGSWVERCLSITQIFQYVTHKQIQVCTYTH